ncbi:uncharacterized protein LOC107812960 [Nicotiana tabacum]|uniref:Uncharacterized protein LOC107812960 n=1 Tax=Nicotiana tabacum TaxID=4097 RepID=A0A1S4BXL3_TOBAC|nr:PREDICTED: uncharacterized protein LOC107812960 [Nicotiana tabacum]
MDTPKHDSWLVRKIFEARKWLVAGIQELKTYVTQGKYNISKVYTSIQPQFPKVLWKALFITQGILPRHQFALWMAIHQRLATVDRLTKWGILVPKSCVLCTTDEEETHDHLFFECPYSKFIWQNLLSLFVTDRQIGRWQEEVEWLSTKIRSRNIQWKILGSAFAAAVYHIWTERNLRRFQNTRKENRDRVREIVLNCTLWEKDTVNGGQY